MIAFENIASEPGTARYEGDSGPPPPPLGIFSGSSPSVMQDRHTQQQQQQQDSSLAPVQPPARLRSFTDRSFPVSTTTSQLAQQQQQQQQQQQGSRGFVTALHTSSATPSSSAITPVSSAANVLPSASFFSSAPTTVFSPRSQQQQQQQQQQHPGALRSPRPPPPSATATSGIVAGAKGMRDRSFSVVNSNLNNNNGNNNNNMGSFSGSSNNLQGMTTGTGGGQIVSATTTMNHHYSSSNAGIDANVFAWIVRCSLLSSMPLKDLNLFLTESLRFIHRLIGRAAEAALAADAAKKAAEEAAAATNNDDTPAVETDNKNNNNQSPSSRPSATAKRTTTASMAVSPKSRRAQQQQQQQQQQQRAAQNESDSESATTLTETQQRRRATAAAASAVPTHASDGDHLEASSSLVIVSPDSPSPQQRATTGDGNHTSSSQTTPQPRRPSTAPGADSLDDPMSDVLFVQLSAFFDAVAALPVGCFRSVTNNGEDTTFAGSVHALSKLWAASLTHMQQLQALVSTQHQWQLLCKSAGTVANQAQTKFVQIPESVFGNPVSDYESVPVLFVVIFSVSLAMMIAGFFVKLFVASAALGASGEEAMLAIFIVGAFGGAICGGALAKRFFSARSRMRGILSVVMHHQKQQQQQQHHHNSTARPTSSNLMSARDVPQSDNHNSNLATALRREAAASDEQRSPGQQQQQQKSSARSSSGANGGPSTSDVVHSLSILVEPSEANVIDSGGFSNSRARPVSSNTRLNKAASAEWWLRAMPGGTMILPSRPNTLTSNAPGSPEISVLTPAPSSTGRRKQQPQQQQQQQQLQSSSSATFRTSAPPVENQSRSVHRSKNLQQQQQQRVTASTNEVGTSSNENSVLLDNSTRDQHLQGTSICLDMSDVHRLLFVVCFDYSLTVTQWNATAEEVTGFLARECVGKKLQELMSVHGDVIANLLNGVSSKREHVTAQVQSLNTGVSILKGSIVPTFDAERLYTTDGNATTSGRRRSEASRDAAAGASTANTFATLGGFTSSSSSGLLSQNQQQQHSSRTAPVGFAFISALHTDDNSRAASLLLNFKASMMRQTVEALSIECRSGLPGARSNNGNRGGANNKTLAAENRAVQLYRSEAEKLEAARAAAAAAAESEQRPPASSMACSPASKEEDNHDADPKNDVDAAAAVAALKDSNTHHNNSKLSLSPVSLINQIRYVQSLRVLVRGSSWEHISHSAHYLQDDWEVLSPEQLLMSAVRYSLSKVVETRCGGGNLELPKDLRVSPDANKIAKALVAACPDKARVLVYGQETTKGQRRLIISVESVIAQLVITNSSSSNQQQQHHQQQLHSLVMQSPPPPVLESGATVMETSIRSGSGKSDSSQQQQHSSSSGGDAATPTTGKSTNQQQQPPQHELVPARPFDFDSLFTQVAPYLQTACGVLFASADARCVMLYLPCISIKNFGTDPSAAAAGASYDQQMQLMMSSNGMTDVNGGAWGSMSITRGNWSFTSPGGGGGSGAGGQYYDQLSSSTSHDRPSSASHHPFVPPSLRPNTSRPPLLEDAAKTPISVAILFDNAVDNHNMTSLLFQIKNISVAVCMTEHDLVARLPFVDLILVDWHLLADIEASKPVLKKQLFVLPCVSAGWQPTDEASERVASQVIYRPFDRATVIAKVIEASQLVLDLREREARDLETDRILQARNDAPWTRGPRLGKGSFGTVYEAINEMTGGVMAVKCFNLALLRERAANDADPFAYDKILSSLTNEIEVMCKLSHPHIVHYFHCERTDSSLNLFMELCERSLHDIIQARRINRGLLEAAAPTIARQTLLAVAYLHERGVCHRDLKPHNIMLRSDALKLTDFGTAAQLTTAGEQMTEMQGTIRYMAPEVFRQESYNEKCDIWSLGCIMAEILNLNLPFMDPNQGMIGGGAGDITETVQLPPVSHLFSENARDFVSLCLQVRQEDRPLASALLLHPYVDLGQDGQEAVFLSQLKGGERKVKTPQPSTSPAIRHHHNQAPSPAARASISETLSPVTAGVNPLSPFRRISIEVEGPAGSAPAYSSDSPTQRATTQHHHQNKEQQQLGRPTHLHGSSGVPISSSGRSASWKSMMSGGGGAGSVGASDSFFNFGNTSSHHSNFAGHHHHHHSQHHHAVASPSSTALPPPKSGHSLLDESERFSAQQHNTGNVQNTSGNINNLSGLIDHVTSAPGSATTSANNTLINIGVHQTPAQQQQQQQQQQRMASSGNPPPTQSVMVQSAESPTHSSTNNSNNNRPVPLALASLHTHSGYSSRKVNTSVDRSVHLASELGALAESDEDDVQHG